MKSTDAILPWSIPSRTADFDLLLVGDTNVQGRTDPVAAFHRVQKILHAGNALFGNLEGPFSRIPFNPDDPPLPYKRTWRHSDPAIAEGYAAAGFSAFGCSSNVWYGREVIDTSIPVLERAGIKYCGSGQNLDAARTPAIVEKDGLRIGFLAYTSVFWPSGHAADANNPGVATIKAYTAYQPGPRALEMPGAKPVVRTFCDPGELEAAAADVMGLRKSVDFVVVSCHWGVSNSSDECEYQREIAHTMIEAGADVVMGHHPHVIQGAEIYRDKPIFYSLGNFAFDWQTMRSRNLDGLLARITIGEGHISAVSCIPIRRDENNNIGYIAPTSPDGSAIIDNFARLCAKNGLVLRSTDSDAVIIERIC